MAELKDADGDHVNVGVPFAVNVADSCAQIVAFGDTVIFGTGLTVIAVTVPFVHPLPSRPITV